MLAFDHSRHSTMIFTVNSTTLMDDVARARACVCVCCFFAARTHARALNSHIYGRRGRGRSPVQRVQANGTKVDCDYTYVYVYLTRARLHVRHTWARVSSILKRNIWSEEFLIYKYFIRYKILQSPNLSNDVQIKKSDWK